MHIKTVLHKNLNRIVAMLMCILLLSNFGLSITLATSVIGYMDFYSSGWEEIDSSIKENQMTVNTTLDYLDYLYMTPKETGIYTITVTSKAKEVKYTLTCTDDYGKMAHPRLAATYANGKYSLITKNLDKDSTTIDVYLKAGVSYQLQLDSEEETTAFSVNVTKRNIMSSAMAVSNIPANVVSAKEYYDRDLQVLEDVGNINKVEFTQDKIDNYASNGMEEDDAATNGGWLEGILVDLIMLFASLFINIVELVIGSNTSLTIDNIIFNRFDQTIIDFSALGGVEVGQDLITYGKGIFSNSNIGKIISVLYDGLRKLSIMIYIVMLLYIGVKILLSIGTANQKKHLNYLEYWLTGLLLSIMIPYLLPVIPAASNALVGFMEDKAQTMSGSYSVKEVLERLGKQEDYLGEDAEIVALQNLIDERIEELDKQIDAPTTKEEVETEINNLIDEKLRTDTSVQNKEAVREKINAVTAIITNNFERTSWDAATRESYKKAVEEVRIAVYENSAEAVEIINSTEIPEEITNDIRIASQLSPIFTYLKRNAPNWTTDNSKEYLTMLNAFKESMFEYLTFHGYSTSKIEEWYKTISSSLSKTRLALIKYANASIINDLEEIFASYEDAVMQEEIDLLKDMRENIRTDVMVTLKTKAQKENRFVYAIAWLILLFQMFSILFMYYKRLFVIIVLIVIFPIVMAFYVIDKLGDGKSQALEKWIKEMFANIFVQVLHAAIYVVLINIGIDACAQDPTRNWFFLVLTTCFLFPAERILRNMVGLDASTLGQLKTNTVTLFATAGAAWNLSRRGYSAAKKFHNNGGVKGAWSRTKEKAKSAVEKEKEKLKDEWSDDKRKDAAKARKQRRDRVKAYRNEIKEENKSERDFKKDIKQKSREASLRDGTAGTFTKLGHRINNSKAKQQITGWSKEKVEKFKGSKFAKKTGSAAKWGAGKIKGAASAVGKAGKWTLKAGGKVASTTGKVARTAGRYAKAGARIARGAAGIAIGVAEGMESFGSEGLSSGIATTRSVASDIGGFKSKSKSSSNDNNNQNASGSSNAFASRFSSRYVNGRKVAGSNVRNNFGSTGGNASANTQTRSNYYSSNINNILRGTVNTNIDGDVQINSNINENS